MPERHDRELWLYVANVTLLATHQVDGAYWEEWDTFRLPGGIEFFLLFNLLILPPLFFGLASVARGSSSAAAWSYVVAALGTFTFAIHTLLLALGNDDFRSPFSIGLLVAILLVSAAQAVATKQASRRSSSRLR